MFLEHFPQPFQEKIPGHLGRRGLALTGAGHPEELESSLLHALLRRAKVPSPAEAYFVQEGKDPEVVSLDQVANHRIVEKVLVFPLDALREVFFLFPLERDGDLVLVQPFVGIVDHELLEAVEAGEGLKPVHVDDSDDLVLPRSLHLMGKRKRKTSKR